MKKKEQRYQKQTAVRDHMIKEYKKQIEQMSDDDFSNLALAIPPTHPMMPVVYQEHQKRSQRKWQELMDTAPSPEMRELAEEIHSPEVFKRFLRETNLAKEFQTLCEGDEEAFEQMMSSLSEQVGRAN